jgi:putative hydrolase of the HAD superfamily
MPDHPRAIFLDALGTLVRFEDPWPALTRLLRKRHGVVVDAGAARLALVAEMRHYRQHCVNAGDQVSLAALRLACARIVIAELGAPARELTPEQLVPTLLAALRFTAFADAVPALERWRAAGKRLVVVSNWDISLHDVLQETGLTPLLDDVLSSAEVGHSKPDPAIFVAALERAGLPAGEVVHIGDSVEEDVAGARAAGIEAVLLRRGEADPHAPDGVRVIASLREW